MATPLDEERARLREAGYTDEEISRYFVERLRGEGQTPSAGGGAAPQANMSGVLGNANAVLGHVRATIPVVASATANLSNPSTPPKQRITSAAILVGVAVIVSVLGFAVWQEWQQHIIYETEIKRLNTEITKINVELTTAQNEKAKAEAEVAKQVAAGQVAQAEKAKEDAKVAPEVAAGQAAEARKKEAEAKYAEELAEGQKAQACTARMDMITKTIPPAEWGDAMEAFNRDCNPVEAKRLKECEEKFKTFITALETLDTSDPHPADTLLAKAKEYKSECPFGEEEKAATQAALDRRQAKIDKITEVLSKLQHRTPEPTPTADATPTGAIEPTPVATPSSTLSAGATPEPSPPVIASNDSYDPVETARQFYRALGEGDGDRASSFVVPEKRSGNFGASEMTRYFGSMTEPLRVSSVSRVDEDTVSVTYHYRYASKDCDATATLTTVNRDGRALINSTKAKC